MQPLSRPKPLILQTSKWSQNLPRSTSENAHFPRQQKRAFPAPKNARFPRQKRAFPRLQKLAAAYTSHLGDPETYTRHAHKDICTYPGSWQTHNTPLKRPAEEHPKQLHDEMLKSSSTLWKKTF
jgi:hypothetical protein